MSSINKNLNYIGLMGSKRNIKMIISKLLEEEIEIPAIDKLHTPIGISIKAETPEEIAISISAEIIKVKNQK